MRRTFAGLMFFVGGITVYACSFPEVVFQGTDGGLDASNDVGVNDTGTDAPAPIRDAIADAPLDAGDGAVDANLLDVAIADEGGKVDAAGCKSCDCDDDGFNRLEAGVDCGAGPFDCDDNDSRTFPTQVFVKDRPESPRNGDWNCDGTVEKGYKEAINCNGLLLGLGCGEAFGFTNPVVECGDAGRWVRCLPVPVLIGIPLACAEDTATIQEGFVQPCR